MSEASNPDVTTLSQSLGITARLAYWSARHRWPIVLLSVIIFVLAILSIAKVGTEMQNGGGVGDSGRADELLVERFEVDPLPGAVVVHARIERIIVSNPSLDVDDPAFQAIVDPLARTIQGFPLVTTVLNYYDDSDTDLRADDRNAVLIVARSEDPTVSHNGDIDVQPIMDAVDRANTSAPGFEVGIISSRIIEDEFEDIIEKDFQRILLVSMRSGL